MGARAERFKQSRDKADSKRRSTPLRILLTSKRWPNG
jgi:hypothetical protein